MDLRVELRPRPSSTTAAGRWPTSTSTPSSRRVAPFAESASPQALRRAKLALLLGACGRAQYLCSFARGLARYDDSYQAQIARQLRLEAAARVRRLTPAWATGSFDPIGTLAALAGQARFVVIGDVAGALHGSPIVLGARTLHVVPAQTALSRIEQVARRLDAAPLAGEAGQTRRMGDDSVIDEGRQAILDALGMQELSTRRAKLGPCGTLIVRGLGET